MKMKPGRELDGLIAEKVMGLTKQDNHMWRDTSVFSNPALPLKNYSTSIQDAWEVLRNHFALGWEVSIKEMDRPEAQGPEWLVCIGADHIQVLGQSAPHAICLAALKAVEGK